MKFYSLLILIAFTSCFSQKSTNYEPIISGLSNNFIFLKKEMNEKNFYESFKINKEKEQDLLLKYKESLDKFYNSPIDIVDFLLTFEENNKEYCNWVKTRNPFKSNIKKYDLLTKSQSALILIDNYLVQHNDKIVMPTYIDKLNYPKIIKFIKSNRHKGKDEITKKYLKLFPH